MPCDAPWLGPVHDQYTKGPLTALSHRYPQRRNVSNTNALHDHQRPPTTQTMTSRLSGPVVRRASVGPANKPSDDAYPALRLGCRGGADGTDDGVGVRHGYDHTSALGDLPGGQRDDADDHDEPRAVPVRPTSRARFSTGPRRAEKRAKFAELDDLSASPWKVLGRFIYHHQASTPTTNICAGQTPYANNHQPSSVTHA